jgi:3-methyl-2-oxobutanoate hydroxymethyltransferase
MKFFEDIIRKKGKEKIVMLTAYDYQIAKILDETDIDMILVGDSLGMVFQGHPNTKYVTMEHMIYHTEAVARGAKNTPIVGDMPINSYKTPDEAIKNAKLFLNAGAHAVKIEGNKPDIIRALLKEDIPVMGHVGLLPQWADKYRVRGREPDEAKKIYKDALELDSMGVFSIVLEAIPEELGKRITESVSVPTIGIGAGRYCDGQVLVINDLLGMDESFKPKFVKRYAYLNRIIKDAVMNFIKDVREGVFPDEEHIYK